MGISCIVDILGYFVSEFFDQINSALPEMEAEFGESWEFNGSSYPAIEIEDLKLAQVIAPGGSLSQATVSLYVRQSIFDGSSAVRGSVLIVRDKKVRIIDTINDGDDSVQVVCGPVTYVIPQT